MRRMRRRGRGRRLRIRRSRAGLRCIRAMLLALIAPTSADVAATSSRLAKVERHRRVPARAAPEEVRCRGRLPVGRAAAGNGRRGVGGATRAARACRPGDARAARGRRGRVAPAVDRRARAHRPRAARSSRALFARATEPEQRLLVGLFLGELRQGALEGVMADAVAKAAGVPACGRAPGGDARRRSRRASPRSRCARAATGWHGSG